jgi:putative CocE/NonD family hydrolase
MSVARRHRIAGRLPCLAVALLATGRGIAAGQSFDFEPPAHVDDAAAAAAVRDLAGRILPVYEDKDSTRYLQNLAALQLLAGSAPAAELTRQQLRAHGAAPADNPPDGQALVQDIYTRARAAEAAGHGAFEPAFTRAFEDALARLDDRIAYAVTSWRTPPLPALRQGLEQAFAQRRAGGAISLAEGLDLVRAWLAYDSARAMGPLLAALDARDEERRYRSEDHLRIRTASGTDIEASLVLPRNATGPLPTLLEYSLEAPAPRLARECAAHGYAGLVAGPRQAAQGPYRAVPFEKDARDAASLIAWVVRQSWSDGRVGMYGSGYGGFTPWAAAQYSPAGLGAIAVSSPMVPGIDVPMEGNVVRNEAYRWVQSVTGRERADARLEQGRWRAAQQDWYRSGKSYFQFDHLVGLPNLFFHRWLHHPSYDGFWQRLLPDRRQLARLDIPMLTTTGYFDAAQSGALYTFLNLRRVAPGADHTLLLGPYDAQAMSPAVQPVAAVLRGAPIDAAARVDLRELRYRWFDAVFKGTPRPALLADRVNFELPGADAWRHAPSIEAMSAARLRLHLSAAPVPDGHRFERAAPPAAAAFVRQSVSLADRSDADWAAPTGLLTPARPLHHAVRYVSDPLPDALDVAGVVSGRLDFAVNRQDVDLSIALYEQLPDGAELALFDPPYLFRASYARDRAHRRLLAAGERQQLPFTVERLVGRRLARGSRIVLVLGVNKDAEHQINYGGGDDVSAESLEAGQGPLELRWYGSSYIEFPVP